MKSKLITAFFAYSLLSGGVAWCSPFTQRHIVGGYCPYCAAAQNLDSNGGPTDAGADPSLAPTIEAAPAAAKPVSGSASPISAQPTAGILSQQSGTLAVPSRASHSLKSSALLNTGSSAGLAPGAVDSHPAKQAADGYWELGFETLASFKFADPGPDVPVTPGSVADIPASVREFEGKRVRLSGYMLPLKIEGGLVTDFLVIRSPMVCCYGVVPAGNEWVVVKTKKGVPPMLDVPLIFQGTLHVGRIYDEKMFAGLYRLDEEKVWID